MAMQYLSSASIRQELDTTSKYNASQKIAFSCFSVSGVNQKHEEKYYRTSSDPMCLFWFIYPLDLKKSWFTPETEEQDGNKFIILN